MSKKNSIISLAVIIAVIIIVLVPKPNDGKSDFIMAVEDAYISTILPTDYNSMIKASAIPPELPDTVYFSKAEKKRDFFTAITPQITPGYYSRPQYVRLDCAYKDLYYTTDGTLPDKNSKKYEFGIDVSETSVICVSAESNGYFSDVCVFSYVILNDATDYKYAYGYNSLDSREKYLYKQIYDSAERFDGRVVIGSRDLTYSNVQKVMLCVNYDNPLMFQMPLALLNKSGSNSNVTSFRMSLDFSEDICRRRAAETRQRADEILALADGSTSLFNYLLTLHDTLLKNAEYSTDVSADNYDDNDYEAFGVMLLGKGVCESYSRAFLYLCQRIGVPCLLIVGESSGEGHMWNMVNIEGEWYHVDLTWDDGQSGEIYHEYFNINDSQLYSYGQRVISPLIDDATSSGKLHTDVNYYPIPAATGNKYNYSTYLLSRPPQNDDSTTSSDAAENDIPDYDDFAYWFEKWYDEWFYQEYPYIYDEWYNEVETELDFDYDTGYEYYREYLYDTLYADYYEYWYDYYYGGN